MDNKHATFLLSRWGASAQDQLDHWQKFESFAPLLPELKRRRGKCVSANACLLHVDSRMELVEAASLLPFMRACGSHAC